MSLERHADDGSVQCPAKELGAWSFGNVEPL